MKMLDLLYPRSCCECGNLIGESPETGLCWDCRADVAPLGPPWCQRCGLAIAGRLDHAFTCSDCVEHPPVYECARSLYHYEGGIRTAIHALKYQRDFSVIPDLSALLLAGLHSHFKEPETLTLVPVPLHRKRQRKRGFNQGTELIRGMKKKQKELLVWKGLKRIKDTETQTKLSKAARRENVRSAFAVKSKLNLPQRILLIDDVMTTGATLDACAKVLKRAGVKEVNTLTLARG